MRDGYVNGLTHAVYPVILNLSSRCNKREEQMKKQKTVKHVDSCMHRTAEAF